MARPIRNTPVLYGEDARRFLSDIDHIPPLEDRIKERERIRRSVQRLQQMVSNLK